MFSCSGAEGSAFGGKGPGLLLMEEEAPEGFDRMYSRWMSEEMGCKN